MFPRFVKALALMIAALALPAAASAQDSQTPRETVVGDLGSAETIIAIPGFATDADRPTDAYSTADLGRRIGEVITADLRNNGLFTPRGPDQVRAIGYGEVTSPQFPGWRNINAEVLVQGFVRAASPSEITVGCYLYDVGLGSELSRQGYVVPARDWRRAAHKCSDIIYSRLTGEDPFFDSRIAYIAESGPKNNRRKQLAVMDSDGANHRILTSGGATALTPRFSPNYQSILYLSYVDGNPRIYIYDIGTGRQRLVTQSSNATFAPRWSPDGRTILYSMAVGGNTDVYRISADGGTPQRLTNAPGIDVGGSFSPDGRQIVFESDRSGSQQVYVMNADGSDQKRISFGGGRYATPEWSPRGDLIAFTKIAGNLRIGVMRPGGGGERLLTDSWQDEAPTWAPNGRVIQFFRTAQGSGETSIWQVDVAGANERRLPTPGNGSDPAWGPIRP